MPPAPHDLVVVGGGIVALAGALAFLRARPGADVVLLEKEDRLAAHQSGHNSGVIHAGVYYAPGSLKAQLCTAGARATRAFCDEHHIPYLDTGKLVVATRPEELPRLAALAERAAANGLAVERIDAAELSRREPNVRGLAALAVPASGIVDYRRVCAAMTEQIRALGGRVHLDAPVVALTEGIDEVQVGVGGRWALDPHRPGLIRARRVLACAGIQADRVARLAGLAPGVVMLPFRGEYYRLAPHLDDVVGHLIYPVPDPSLPFLGVHLTRLIDGGVSVGPNAVLGLAREGYPRWSVDGGDLREMLRAPGFWRVAKAQFRTGVGEQWNSAYRPGYLALVRRYCPSVELADLQPMEAGIRAQAVRPDGSMVEDFLFARTDRMLHVLNAPSPAATSALPIGEHVIATLLRQGPVAP